MIHNLAEEENKSLNVEEVKYENTKNEYRRNSCGLEKR